MPLLTLSFLVGIVLVQQFSQLPNFYGLAICAVLIIGCAWKRYWHICLFLVGFLWANLFALDRLSEQLPKNLEDKELNISGYVISLPQADSRRVTFDLQITEAAEKLPNKVRLSWYNATQTVKAGQHWQFTVKLKRPHGMFNPAGFDYETWLFSQNIGATGYIRKSEPQLLATGSALYFIPTWRQAISDKLTRLMSDSANLGLIKALGIGDGSEINDAQWQVFRKTGTIHLIVISGSHISLVAGMAFFLARKFWAKTTVLALSPPTFAAIFSLLVALFYSALAGFSVPTQRAMIMVAVVMLGIIFQRHIKPINSLALALFLILLFDPVAVLAPGFWLSFAAVIVIVYCSANRLGKISNLFPIVHLHFVVTLGLSPLLLFFFQQMSIISPLANFIAVPAVEFLAVPQILIALLLIFIQPTLAAKLLFFIGKQLDWLYWLLNKLAALPFATLNHPQPSWWSVLLATLGIFLLFAPKGIPARGLSVVLCLPLIFNKTDKINTGEFTLTLLDVGQGLSAVIQTSQHILVFDTGAKFSADFDMGKAVLLPFLRSLGTTHIDRLMISHGDNDHIGGAQSLLDEMKVNSIYTSAPQKFPQNAPIKCIAGQYWQWNQVEFTVLSPSAKNNFLSENNNSCVLKVTALQGSVLLTGDIESEAEQQLVTNSPALLNSKILIAPHHGSKTSSTSAFLTAVNPEFILIPAAYKNRYHFPHPSVINRYQNKQIKWLMTGTSGAIKVKIAYPNITSFSYRTEEAKYWQDK